MEPELFRSRLTRPKSRDRLMSPKYGCDQTGCGGLSVVEQPASLIGALNSPPLKRSLSGSVTHIAHGPEASDGGRRR